MGGDDREPRRLHAAGAANAAGQLGLVVVKEDGVPSFRKFAELHLQDNRISSLDKLPGIASLPALTHLDLSGNNLSSLDLNGTLTSLKVLAVANNDLRSLPASAFANCAKLTELDLSENRLASVHCVKKLPALSTLRLSRNCIEAMGALPPCKCLEELHLDANRLETIVSAELATLFPSLDLLDLVENRLCDTPVSLVEELKGLEQLLILRIAKNLLCDEPHYARVLMDGITTVEALDSWRRGAERPADGGPLGNLSPKHPSAAALGAFSNGNGEGERAGSRPGSSSGSGSGGGSGKGGSGGGGAADTGGGMAAEERAAKAAANAAAAAAAAGTSSATTSGGGGGDTGHHHLAFVGGMAGCNRVAPLRGHLLNPVTLPDDHR